MSIVENNESSLKNFHLRDLKHKNVRREKVHNN